MAPRLRLVYDQMSNLKYIITIGACFITEELYFDSYNVFINRWSYTSNCLDTRILSPEILKQDIMLFQEK
jgi:NADH:ubiquinone oxidoreductase subunit B-like Fe-S oxidoreductase